MTMFVMLMFIYFLFKGLNEKPGGETINVNMYTERVYLYVCVCLCICLLSNFSTHKEVG